MQSRNFALSLLALSLLAGAIMPVQAQQPTKLLRGSAAVNTTTGPSLNRGEIKPTNNDPFSGTDDDGELLEVPKNVRQEPVRAPVVKKPFNLNAQQQGNPYNPQHAAPVQAPVEMGGEGDPMPAAAQQPAMPPPPAFNPNDPDTSPDMQLAWDLWHKRVAQSIFERFNFFAKAAFRNSPPLMAKLTYTVTRDGHIMNLNMPQKANNVLFNVLVHQSVKSLEGDMSILAFPEGSRRMWVPKSGTFTQNYGGGEGFRYTVGDRETVQGGGRR